MAFKSAAKVIELTKDDVALFRGKQNTSTYLNLHHWKGAIIDCPDEDVSLSTGKQATSTLLNLHHWKGVIIELVTP
jgi:hypothetical protein